MLIGLRRRRPPPCDCLIYFYERCYHLVPNFATNEKALSTYASDSDNLRIINSKNYARI